MSKSHSKSTSIILFLALVLSTVLFPMEAAATPAPQLSTTNLTDQTYFSGNETAVVVDDSIVVSGSFVNGANVYIGAGFDSGNDVLACDGTLAEPDLASSYNTTTGVLTIKGEASAADYQLVLRSVTYYSEDSNATGSREVVFSVADDSVYAFGAHYYEAVNNGSSISWTDARDAAATRYFYGMTGYLTTITSAEENAFIFDKVNADAWIGASDEDSEGDWLWVTGPEAGTQFSEGNYSLMDGSPVAVGGAYMNWAEEEPNDASGEDYAHMQAEAGKWNDYGVDNPNARWYVVEYSSESEDPIAGISTRTIQITVPSISIDDTSERESKTGSPTLSFTVSLSDAIDNTVTVDYDSVAGGTATLDEDYTGVSGTLTFEPGTLSKTIEVAILDDSDIESNETVFIALSDGENATIADGNGVGTIQDNDRRSHSSDTPVATPEEPASLTLRLDVGMTDSYLTLENGAEVLKPMDVAPMIHENRTFLPIRFIVEPLGGTVKWNQAEQKITILQGDTTIELWIGNNMAKINGVSTMIDKDNADIRPMIVEPGRTMLPMRFIAEALGCTVDWDELTQKIIVTK